MSCSHFIAEPRTNIILNLKVIYLSNKTPKQLVVVNEKLLILTPKFEFFSYIYGRYVYNVIYCSEKTNERVRPPRYAPGLFECARI